MLVYARVHNKDAIISLEKRDQPRPSPVLASEIVPPPKAMEAVTSLNAAHEKACKGYAEQFVTQLYILPP